MPPRAQLTADEAARLPALLRASPTTRAPFPRHGSNDQRVLWVLAAYAADDPLSANLITWLVFDEGPNVARETISVALEQAIEAGWVVQREGFQLTPDGVKQVAQPASDG
jgi:hypothetical protein